MCFIWLKNEEQYSFSEFKDSFLAEDGKAVLKFSADFRCAIYLNGAFVAFGQYADYSEGKIVDEVDVSAYVRKGENELFIVAYHMGEDHFVCRTKPACVAFELSQDGKVLVASSENTLCRQSTAYTAGDMISFQQGRAIHYSFTAEDAPWEKATVKAVDFQTIARPIHRTVLGEKELGRVVAQGTFRWNGGEDTGMKLQKAWLSSLYFNEMTGKGRREFDRFAAPLTFQGSDGDGVYVVIDLDKERAGYPYFSVEVKKACKLYMGWGEHLADLRVRTGRMGRNFVFGMDLKAGVNDFSQYLIRFGCRYLCLFVETDELTVHQVGFQEENYPFPMPRKDFGDRLLNQIYETGRRTLLLCAHEHYEDCPWREQALYGMDSRNQMLFGYGAFGEYDFARNSILMLLKSVEEDGLISICPPSQAAITIPSFSVYAILAFCENAEADYQQAFVDEGLPYAERLMQTFADRIKGGVVHTFVETRYWNFHEWSEGLDAVAPFRDKEVDADADAILTALTYRALKAMEKLESKQGRTEQAKAYGAYAAEIANSLELFYDAEKGLYVSYITKDGLTGYHAYTQAMFLTTDLVPTERVKALREVLKYPEGKVVDITVGAYEVKYDALLRDPSQLSFVVEEICKKFGSMLYQGATSFWETAEGEADFDDAGSLCHGWAAVGCYVMDKYMKNLA